MLRATDMYKIDRRFGSNEEFVAFVEACHEKVKSDHGYDHNHIGDQHWWMKIYHSIIGCMIRQFMETPVTEHRGF